MTQQQNVSDKTISRRPACIVIPTTDGLVWLCGLKERSASLNSHITLVDDFRQLPVSKEYHQFVSVPLKQIRQDEASVHIELSKPIDSGRSWEFPVLLAHLLHRDGLLAFPDLKALEAGNDPGCDLVWATGKLDADLMPVVGDYSLSQKFCLSEDALETFRHHGRQVDLILGGPLSKDVSRKVRAFSQRLDLSFQEVSQLQDIDFLRGKTGMEMKGTGMIKGFVKRYIPKSGAVAIGAFLSIIAVSFAMTSLMSDPKMPLTKVADVSVVTKEADKKDVATNASGAAVPNKMKDSNVKTVIVPEKDSKATMPVARPEKAKKAKADKMEKILNNSGTKTAVSKPKPKPKLQQTENRKTRPKADISKQFVIKVLKTSQRNSCGIAANLVSGYCTDNPQACQNIIRNKVFEAGTLQASDKARYRVQDSERKLCGFRFRNTGQEPLKLELDQKIAPFSFAGSSQLFRPFTLQVGQSIDLYLKRMPKQLKTTLKLIKGKADPIDLILEF